MKNNQEHKIDKIFRETFENQSFTPPSDAWMGIHTYTIGQEESKKRVWLKYAAFAMILLLVSSLGLWYFVDNQIFTNKEASKLLSHKVVRLFDIADNNHGGKNAGRVKPTVELPASVRNGEILSSFMISPFTSPLFSLRRPRLNLDSSDLRISGLKSDEKNQKSRNPINPSSDGVDSNSNTPALLTPKVDWSGDQPRDGALLSQELLVENTNNGGEDGELTTTSLSQELLIKNTNNDREGENKIENIEPKPLIINDLSEKMQKESERKIVALEEKIVDKKEIYKEDSVVYGDKFSLKHPIISFRLGLYQNSLNVSANNGGEVPFVESSIGANNIYFASATFGLAWKLNDRARVSLNFNYCTYSSIDRFYRSALSYVDPLSPNNKPSGTFKYNSSKDVYEYLTPLGYITQQIDPKLSSSPKDFDVILGGSVTVWQIGSSYEYDFISLKSKKGIPSLQMYGAVGINLQGALKNRYSFVKFRNYDPAIDDTFFKYPKYPKAESFTEKNLANSSPIVLGYNVGIGTRFQLSKRFGMNFSINYDGSVTSWVHNLPFQTRLSVLSAQSGFFVNL